MRQRILDSISLAALAEFPRRLDNYYGTIPTAYKNWRPVSWEGVPSEPFTAIEQLCHVRDIEIDGYHVRFRRALQETEPMLASIDGENLARERAYAAADAAQALQAFAEARRTTLALLAPLTAQQLDRRAQFEGNTFTVRGLVHNLISHDQQHLAGLQWLLARMSSERGFALEKARQIAFQPHDRHTIIPRIIAVDAKSLVDFVRQVFGSKGSYRPEVPAELEIGDSIVMISDAGVRPAMPACLYVYVPDADATWQRAIDAGAEPVEPPSNVPWGDRRGIVVDRWGNAWQIATHAAGS